MKEFIRNNLLAKSGLLNHKRLNENWFIKNNLSYVYKQIVNYDIDATSLHEKAYCILNKKR